MFTYFCKHTYVSIHPYLFPSIFNSLPYIQTIILMMCGRFFWPKWSLLLFVVQIFASVMSWLKMFTAIFTWVYETPIRQQTLFGYIFWRKFCWHLSIIVKNEKNFQHCPTKSTVSLSSFIYFAFRCNDSEFTTTTHQNNLSIIAVNVSSATWKLSYLFIFLGNFHLLPQLSIIFLVFSTSLFFLLRLQTTTNILSLPSSSSLKLLV